MAYQEDILRYDDDDVPSDFFDDFSNQDFMAGLDVVDVWDDEEEAADSKFVERPPRLVAGNQKRKIESPRKPRRNRRRNRNKFRMSRSPSAERRKRLKREIDDKKKRDPEKTKRDIQKDKDKWEKNKEAKIISEKLKVVETGLVPPGTEMEFDIQEVNPLANVVDLREKLRKRSRSASFDLSTRLTRERRNRGRDLRRSPPARHRTRTRSRTRSLLRRHPSLLRRRPSLVHHHSGSHRKSVSPYRRSISPHRRSMERRIEAERHGRYGKSPSSWRHHFERSRSPENLEREAWLRSRAFQRNRSASPPDLNNRRRNAPKDFLEELADKLKYDEKKKLYLKEISHQLNEPLRPNPQMNQMFVPRHLSVPGPGPEMGMIPQPMAVGPPNHYFPPPVIDPAPQYDQSFFIGQPEVFHNSNSNPNMFPHPTPAPFDPHILPKMVPQPIKLPRTNVVANVNVLNNERMSPSGSSTLAQEDKKTASKLLEDKAITLSDYLSMSVKYNGTDQPVGIQKKVKVLAQCQDAIKALGNASKLNGRFFYMKNNKEVAKSTEIKGLSPLRKIPISRFAFTTPGKGPEEKTVLQLSLQKLLVSMGIAVTAPPPPPESKRMSSPLTPGYDVKPFVATPAPQTPSHIVTVTKLQKLCQTDPVKCEKCEIRKAVKYNNQGTQSCVSTIDTATQITEDDIHRYGFKPFLTTVGVNQSLAHLTPAQLLGKDEPPKREFFSSHRMVTPPPPNITPEKKNVRTEFPARRAPNTSMAPSFIDQLQMSMKPFDPPNVGGRQNFLSAVNDSPMPSRPGNFNRDQFSPGFNRGPEFRDHNPQFVLQREENIRIQQQRLFFEPPDRSQGYGPRPFF